MAKCKGCKDAVATRYVPNNRGIILCAPCADLLWGLRTRPIEEKTKHRCLCGCRRFVSLRGTLTVLCLLEVYEWLYELGGGNLSLLNDNPFVFQLARSHIEFSVRLQQQYPNMERNSGAYFTSWYKRGELPIKRIDFSGLQDGKLNGP